jgi:hypothetical protein
MTVDTPFDRAANYWGTATAYVLNEGAELAMHDVSVDVRATEMVRSLGRIRGRLVHAIAGGNREEIGNAVLGLRSLAALLDNVADQLEDRDDEAAS